MSSEYAKWLQRGVEKEKTPPLSPGDRLKNWWYYHKWLVIGGVVLFWIVLGLIWNASGFGRVQPDYQIAYVGTDSLPTNTAQALTEALEELGTDLNGDGQVVVQLNEYPFPDASDGNEVAAAIQTSSEAALMADLMECESYFFLLEDPDDFQLRYQALAQPDGSCPEDTDRSGLDKAILWTDCPALASLQLGEYTEEAAGQTYSGSSDQLVSQLYLARRCFYAENENQVAYPQGCAAFWDLLTGA